MATAPHDPVMVDRIVELLSVPDDRDAVIVDCTLGAGGHAARLLAASGEGTHLVGFDRDPDALQLAGRRLAVYGSRVTLVHAPFDDFTTHVDPVVRRHGPLLGVLYDLGVSSMQLDTPGRGFSFRSFGPLDMRMDSTAVVTAADLVNEASPAELERYLRDFGEERHAARIVQAIVEHRPFTSTLVLADLVAQAMPRAQRKADRARGIHPATRTFQGLRIAVNGELERFSASLPQALDTLARVSGASSAAPVPGSSPRSSASSPAAGIVSSSATSPADGTRGGRPSETAAHVRESGFAGNGRIATLSYHSLEDRIVKRFFSDAAGGCICPPGLPVCGCGRVPLLATLTRGAQSPTEDEVQRNPRSRSAKLRVAERLPGAGAIDAG
ncbi:MAG: 16S rRNA (cytosine(1402)-N(4))-methyltransferase RsmH [Euzebya sp.]